MPWQVDGTFLRVNPDYSGDDVWQQDQQAGVKIIAFRHDNHDEDLALGIAQCLNIDGYNAMAADLDMDGNQLANLATASASGQAVEFDQFDALSDTVAAIVTTDPDNIISAMSWDGTTLTLTRANGDFTVDLDTFDTIKSNGTIRHLGAALTPGATVTVNPANGNRFTLVNNVGAGTAITITRPTGADADLGETYQVEGQIMIKNDATTPGALSLSGVAAADIIGAPSASANVSQILSYCIMRFAGDTYIETYVWSTP